MIKVVKYTVNYKNIWNDFIDKSKNQVFMFYRDYMEYHKDRYIDHSLLFFNEKNELVAVLPMTENSTELISHGGLTYGGFISDTSMKQHTMNECFQKLIEYASDNGFNELYYKVIPHIFHKYPAEEDRYSLFINGAQLVRVESATIVSLYRPLKMPKGRKAQISRAKREGVEVKELRTEEEFKTFIELENQVLTKHHSTRAVHTGEELYLLHSRFPNNIRLYVALKENEIIAGTVIFEYEDVVHTQYLAANDIARRIGALDLVIFTVMERYKDSKHWFDFGISTENGGRILNEGLISQKESFGGRTNTYEMWKISL